MFVFFRALIYSTLFIGFFLVYLPVLILNRSGTRFPANFEWPQICGIILGFAGAFIALWCILSFVTLGKGTPAPFDPPLQLVVRGPYRLVRNPMYLAAGMGLIGVSIFCGSLQLLVYTGILFVVTHLLVIWYEEPTLKRSFGEDYDSYCSATNRWFPKLFY